MEINNLLGDITDVSAKKEAPVPGSLFVPVEVKRLILTTGPLGLTQDKTLPRQELPEPCVHQPKCLQRSEACVRNQSLTC